MRSSSVGRGRSTGLVLLLLATLTMGSAGADVQGREPDPGSPTPVPDQAQVKVPSEAEALAFAQRAIQESPEVLRLAAGETVTAGKPRILGTGMSHVRYQRTYKGLPVLHGGFIVHIRADGTFAGATVSLSEPINVDIVPALTAQAAGQAAVAEFVERGGSNAKPGEPTLVVETWGRKGRLAWAVPVDGVSRDGRLDVSVDARTGEIILAVPDRLYGRGHGEHSGVVHLDTTPAQGGHELVDPLRGNAITCDANHGEDVEGPPLVEVPCTTFVSTTDSFGDGTRSNRQSAAADAHWGHAVTYDYLKSVHGRNGVFDDGRGVKSRVHYGTNFDNAFWSSSLEMVAYGTAASNHAALDVVAHELGHGVTQHSAGLTYAGESGGLNEATSDIFGVMAEFYAGRGDYTLFEDLTGVPERVMFDAAFSGSVDCWHSGVDRLDPHESSGIGNRFFFMLAEGSGPTQYGNAQPCAGKPHVTGIGRQNAEKLWYHALTNYFGPVTEYVQGPGDNARAHTLSSAVDLFGLCTTEYKAVQAAWTAVNVEGQDAPCPQPPQNVWALPNPDGTIYVGWDWNPEAAFYEVQMRDVTAGETAFTPVPAKDPTQDNLTIGLLTHDHEYEFQVIARNRQGGPSDPSAPVRARCHYAAPGKPANLRASANPDGTIALVWDKLADNVYYLVYQRDITEDPDSEFKQLEYPVDGTSLTVTYLLHGHTYEYKVSATNAGGESQASEPARATSRYATPTGAPANLRATPGDGQVTLDWDPVPGDNWYWVYFKDVDAGETEFTKGDYPVADGTTVTMGLLLNGHRYEFKVAAFNQGGEGPASAVVGAKPLPPLPGKPTGLTANAQSDGTIKLTWTAPGEDLWYWIYVQDGTQPWTRLPHPVADGSTTFTAALLTHRHTYRFKVSAINLAGEGPQSDAAQAVSNYAPPPAPIDLRGVTAGDGTIDLIWDAPADNLHYWVWMKDTTTGQAWQKLQYPTTDTLMSVGPLMHGHAYDFKVTAQNQGGVGPASNVIRVVSRGGLPPVPANVRATAGDGKVQLSWNASAGAGSYWVYLRDKTANQSFKRLQYPVTGTSFAVSPLTNGHTYEFRIAASNASGDSALSPVVSARPMPPMPQPPTGLTARAGDGIVNLRWNPSPSPNSLYWIEYRDATTNQGWQRLKYPISATTFVARYLWNGHTYQFRVRATNLSGDSAPTAAVSARPMPPFPQPPSGLTATPGDGLVSLRWNASPTGNTWYWVEFRDASANQGWQRLRYPVKTTSFVARYLWNGHTYQFRIRATNLSGDSAPTAVVSARPMPPFPQPPTNLTVDTVGDGNVYIAWRASATRNVMYWVELRDNTQGNETPWQRLPHPVMGTSLGVYYLTNFHTYYFRVRAVNLAGTSAPSNVVHATPYHLHRIPDWHPCIIDLQVEGHPFYYSRYTGWEAQRAKAAYRDCPVVPGRDWIYLEHEVGPNNWMIHASRDLGSPNAPGGAGTGISGCAHRRYAGRWRARIRIEGRSYYSLSVWCPRF